MTINLQPVPPRSLNPLTREILTLLAGHPAAGDIVIGGGVALAHYLEYRDTVDLDAWWKTGPSTAADSLIMTCMETLADRHGMVVGRRRWGDTESFELLREGKKIFSLQIATRDRYLHEAVPAAWQPVLIETFEDNMASKMTALVERGAPRDLRDVHEVCSRSLVSVNDCWALYRLKHPAQDAAVAADKVLFAIERLDLQRPLATIADTTVREQAGRLRTWYRDVFCPAGRL